MLVSRSGDGMVSHPGPDPGPPRSTGRGGWKPSNPSLARGLFFNFTRSPKARVIKFYVLPRILRYFLPTMAGNWDYVGYRAFLPVAMFCLGDTAMIKSQFKN